MHSLVRLVLVLSLVAAGCGGDDADEGPTAAELVSQAAEAFEETKSFHLVYDLANAPSGSGLLLTHAEGDVAVSDGVQEGIELDVAGTFSGIPLESQLVIVEGDGLLKDPLTGAWRELDVTQVPGAFFDLLDGVPAVLRSIEEPERAGEDTVGGVAVDRLRGMTIAANLASFLGNEKSNKRVPVDLWIGREDSLIRRIEVKGPVEDGEPIDVKRTVELSAFGKSVTIERPVP